MSVTQDQFRRAMLDPAAPVPDGLLDGADRPAGRRFNVYRNNVAVSLTEAMRTGFPVITRLLGQQNMDGLSGLFLRAHPPASPLMMHYGAEFPAFLEGMEQLSHLPYLADVARLELALRRSYHAADAAPLAPEALGAADPEALMQSGLTLVPAAILLRSPWPVHAIWRFNTEPGAPKPTSGAQDVLITRPEFDPIPVLLPPGGADWIAALMDGHSIGDAHTRAQDAAADFDLATTLGLMLQGGALRSLITKKD
ncbi:MAG: DNA-binding domain-containing protein [Marinibacterium sp.]|nr:DNA-binding domain-containing protein [Marinibacterium sp.]